MLSTNVSQTQQGVQISGILTLLPSNYLLVLYSLPCYANVYVVPQLAICLQVTFNGATQQMHGSDNGFPRRPDWDVPFSNGSNARVIRMFGTARGSRVTSIGFKTSKRRTHGPWGDGGGEQFLVDGEVLGFFGAIKSGSISGIGVWYAATAAGIFPVDPKLPTTAYGNLSDVWTANDARNRGGAHQNFSFPICLLKIIPYVPNMCRGLLMCLCLFVPHFQTVQSRSFRRRRLVMM